MTSPLHAPLADLIGAWEPLALGAGDNASALELTPFGHSIRFVDAVKEHRWVDLYRRSNALAFGDPFPLPGWVLADLFLLPAAITLLPCKGNDLPVATRLALNLAPDDDAIAAAYLAVPCAERGLVMGVSLLSFVGGRGVATATKALGLGMMRARKQRGLTQWDNKSLRPHTRMGPLRVVGPAPRVHEHAETSFVYEVDLSDENAWAAHLTGTAPALPFVRIPVADRGRLGALAERAYDGERIMIVPPGLSPDGSHVYVNDGSNPA